MKPADEFPGVLVDDMVFFVKSVRDPDFGDEVARRGDVGYIRLKEPGCAPMVECERTGRSFDALPGYDFEVIAPPLFASSPETTPKKALTVFIRRGKS